MNDSRQGPPKQFTYLFRNSRLSKREFSLKTGITTCFTRKIRIILKIRS